MEFHEILAIAQKRQLKRDKEVKEIDQLAKQRRLERFNELEQARKASIREKPTVENHKSATQTVKTTVGDKSKAISKNNGPILQQTKAACSVQDKNHRSVSVSTTKVTPCIEKSTAATETNQKSSSIINPSNQSASKVLKTKTPKLSFAELLEIAKRNENAVNVKKQKFDDLIPCSLDSTYRRLDNRTGKSDRIPEEAKSMRRSPPDIATGNPSRVSQEPKPSFIPAARKRSEDSNNAHVGKSPKTVTNGVTLSKSIDNPFKSSNVKSQVAAKSARQEESKGIVPRIHSDRGVSKEVRKIDVSSDKRPVAQKSSVGLSRNETTHRSAIALQLQAKVAPTALTSESLPSKQLPKNQIPVSRDNSGLSQQMKQFNVPREVASKKERPLPKNPPPVSSQPRMQTKQVKRDPEMPRQMSRGQIPREPAKTDPPICRGSGIAAQLGINLGLAEKSIDESEYECSEDDYESDDSFIDDSDVVESKEYARVVRDIHKALRFDPRKYKEVNPWDDLRSMEANYRDIEKEEKRSARLGAKEDALELERDLQRKKAKLLNRTAV